MRKYYRLSIAIISLIGAIVMGIQHQYLLVLILLILSAVFFKNRNQGTKK